MTYIGIDPGKSGGIAWIDEDGGGAVAETMPDTIKDILDLLCSIPSVVLTSRCAIELVHSSPQMGVKSAFTFGQGYGALLMALTACEIPYTQVAPSKWQRAMQCLTKGDKNVSKRRAQQLFPSLKITHATADALLLAEYCRTTHK